jgi:flagellin
MVNRDLTLSLAYDGGTAVEVTFNYGSDANEAAANFETAFNALSAAEKAALDGSTVSVAGGTATVTSATAEAADLAVTGTVAAGDNTGAVFQVGANQNQTVEVNIKAVSASDLGVDALVIGELADETTIATAIGAIDSAISTVSENRSELGAMQNRMESTIRNLSVAVENLSAAESRIRDTDMALEMVEFTRNQILSQAGTAMLAQANVVPQSVLSLLG